MAHKKEKIPEKPALAFLGLMVLTSRGGRGLPLRGTPFKIEPHGLYPSGDAKFPMNLRHLVSDRAH
jgi:hypothetical protein